MNKLPICVRMCTVKPNRRDSPVAHPGVNLFVAGWLKTMTSKSTNFVCFSVCLFFCVSVFLFFYFSVCLFVSLSLFGFVSLSLFLFVSLSICLFPYLSTNRFC